MEQTKKKLGAAAKFFLFIGVALILIGIIYPSVRYSNNDCFMYMVKQHLSSKEAEYEVIVITDKKINTNSAILTVDGENFFLRYDGYLDVDKYSEYDLEASEIGSKNVYKFEKTLQGTEYYSTINKEVSVSCKLSGGQVIELKDNTDYMNTKILITALLVGFGVMICFITLVVQIIKRGIMATRKVVQRVAYGDGENSVGILGAIEEKLRGPKEKEPENRVCEYCGSINKLDATRCSECRAPIKIK